jgi:hypothetical protein
MHTDNVREDSPGDRAIFRRNAAVAGRVLGVTPVPIRSGQDVLEAIRRSPGDLGTVVLVGHGTQTSFFEPRSFGIRARGSDSLPAWLSAETFARELARKARRGVIVSLAGCSAGASPAEYRDPSTVSGDGGADSLAGIIRDTLQRAGVGGEGGEVRAHTTQGTVLMNPQGRTFKIKSVEVGRPGRHIMGMTWGREALDTRSPVEWQRFARGNVATRWMLGGDLPRRT